LLLGPFEGQPTEHIRIAFGVGICGQAAKQKKRFVIQDVTKETNHLSCSKKVRAKIAFPIFCKNEVVWKLEIDPHYFATFTKENERFLERICNKKRLNVFKQILKLPN